jgi:hypothetical protein
MSLAATAATFLAPPIRLQASPGVRRLVWGLVTLVLALIPGLTLLGPSTDLDNYRILYEWAGELGFGEVLLENDPGYMLLSRAAIGLGLSFAGFLLLLALLTCSLRACLLARIRTDRVTLVILYLSYLFWLHDYTQIRFSLGLVLVMLGLTNAGAWRWLLFVLGATVHASVILVVVVALVLQGRKRALAAAALVVLALAASGVLDTLVLSVAIRIATYQDFLAAGVFDQINRFSLMPAVQGIALLSCWSTARRAGAEASREWWLAAFGLACFYGLAEIPVLAFRLYEMFIPFFLILVSRVWRCSAMLQLLMPVYLLLGLRVSFFSADALLPLLR